MKGCFEGKTLMRHVFSWLGCSFNPLLFLLILLSNCHRSYKEPFIKDERITCMAAEMDAIMKCPSSCFGFLHLVIWTFNHSTKLSVLPHHTNPPWSTIPIGFCVHAVTRKALFWPNNRLHHSIRWQLLSSEWRPCVSHHVNWGPNRTEWSVLHENMPIRIALVA